MEKTIDKLTQEADTIKQDIDQLKTEVDQMKKKEKEAVIKQRISTLQEELTAKMEALKDSSNETEQKEYEAVKTLSESLTQLSDLANEVVGGASNSAETSTLSEQTPTSSEKKSLWTKTKDMWNEGRGTRAKMGFSVAGIAAGVYSIVQLFKGRSKEEKEKHEKKSWRGRTWGNIKRYGRIALGGIGGFLGIKWLMDKYGEKTPDNHNTSKNQVESYEKLNESEQQPYEHLGNATDDLYGSIFAKELENGWEDDADMNTLSEQFGNNKTLKGVVPWCMDNSFSSVGSILSESGIEWDILKQDLSGISLWLKNKISTPIGKGLLKFLNQFPSWVPGTKSVEEYIKEWINEKPQERKMQLKAFFRQQNRITVFLKTKQGELVKKIAQKKFQSDPSGFDDAEEAMENADRFKRNIEDDLDYQSFKDNKIANASNILTRYEILNGKVDEDTMEIVQECDEERDEILYADRDGNDVLSRARADAEAGNLSDKNKEQLRKSCKEIQKDIVKLEEIAEKDALDMYAKLGNTENINKQELLRHGSILPLLKEIREEGFSGVDAKIAEGKFSIEDYNNLKMIMNNYFALKKELEIGTHTYQLIKSDDGSWRLRIGTFALDCFKNMGIGIGKWTGGDFWGGLERFSTGIAPIAIVEAGVHIVGAGVHYVKKHPWKTLKFIAKTPLVVPAAYTVGLRTARLVSGKYRGPSGSLRRIFFDGAEGPTKLIGALKEGRISLDKARAIIEGSQGKFVQSAIKTKRNSLYSANDAVARRILLKKVHDGTTLPDTEWDLIAKYFDKKAINKRLVGKSTDDVVNVVADLKHCERITMNAKNKKVFDMVLEQARLSSADLRLLADNIGKIDIAQFSEKELAQLAKKLAKKGSWSSFGDVSKLQALASNINIAPEVVNHNFFRHLDAMKRQQEGVLSRITDPKLHDSINKQIKNIDNLKNELKTTSSLDALDDLDELWNSLRKFTKAKVPPLNVIDVFTDMHTLNKANIFDDVDILKKLDFTKLSDLAKEAKYAPIKQQLDNIADAFMHFHSQNLKLIARNADLAHPLKTLIKFLAKAT